jgi:tRNA(Phe) wybutosine-synthesizing methylase Tyw3
LQTSQVGLFEIGKAVHRMLETDTKLAADVKRVLTSTDALKEIMEIGFLQLAEGQEGIKRLIEQISKSTFTIHKLRGRQIVR